MPRTQLLSEDRIVLEKTTPSIRLQLLDKHQRPISKSVIETLTITYKTVADPPVVINSRNEQDAKDNNEVTIQADLSIQNIDSVTPILVRTTANHELFTGDHVFLTGISGMTELNGRVFVITRESDQTFSLNGESHIDKGSYISGGTVYTGVVEWVMQLTDTVINDTTNVSYGHVESHNVRLDWTYDTNKVGGDELQVDVRRKY